MMKILAPTRGGPASSVNQDRAISIAKERTAELFFLYITDISLLDQHASSLMFELEDELEELGGFVLAMAQERASMQGVEAQAIVRRGHFGDVLEAVIAELGIDCLILGSPEQDTGITTFDFLRQIAGKLGETHQIETLVIHKGEVVYQHGPD
ncbi:MAG: universal stress protein [Anaerolineales bacterium]|nr:MAG: universal stress protein [Anaerolineales bacterium]